MTEERSDGFFVQIGGAAEEFFSALHSLIEFVGETVCATVDALLHPHRIRWRDTWKAMEVCGPDGMPITFMICFLTGIILAYQSAVQMHKYGADTFLPALIGCTIVRELGPLMAAIVASGRSGSAFAAEIATMKVSEELDALQTMGFSTTRFLLIPKLIAMMTMLPLLTVIGDFVGIMGGLVIGVTELNISFGTYLQLTKEWVSVKYFMEGVIKSFVFAWLIAVAGCWCGFSTGNDAVAVGKATTRAVVISILLIVIADAVLAKIFSTFYGLGA